MKSAAITQRVKFGKQVSMILDCVHQTKHRGPVGRSVDWRLLSNDAHNQVS